ncbi:MAG: flagellar protein [Lachnospiraceae bacterium]|nr:flagellar protein [Lachnospiraceae bacterium]
MNVKSCRKCGRMFNYIAGMHICPPCREKLEEKFLEVKNYLRDNKGAGINEVAEACEVEPQQIAQWLREDRLELTSDSAVLLNCDRCGTPIRSGRYCDKCRAEMTTSLNSMARAINSNGASPANAKKPGGAHGSGFLTSRK